MEQLIQEYENEHKLLGERLAELRAQLKTEKLQTQERESIEMRMYLITAERVDLVHVISDMKQHLGGVS